MPVFISFEGGEGCGKTTQARRLFEKLQALGVSVSLVHEPGSTELGWALRGLLKAHRSRDRRAELLLFAAARAELVAKIIQPALAQERVVVADRYADSSIAYQGYGRGIDIDLIRRVNEFATQGVTPDLTVLLDVEPEEAMQRLSPALVRLPSDVRKVPEHGRIDTEGQRRFEEEPLQFHKRIRKGYLKLAREEPKRWLVVPASQPPEAIARVVWDRVEPLIRPLLDTKAMEAPQDPSKLL